MRIALSTDHSGYDIIGDLTRYIKSLGHEVYYFGPDQNNPEDDYPELIAAAARAVADGEADKGIVFGGSGQGEAMAANRIKGVRAALFYGLATAKVAVDIEGNVSDDPYEILKLSRQHNDSNVLSLSARFLNQEEMQHAIKIWLETPFSDVERHQRRVNQLDELS